jgi:hypothetical protein
MLPGAALINAPCSQAHVGAAVAIIITTTMYDCLSICCARPRPVAVESAQHPATSSNRTSELAYPHPR